MLNTPIEHPKTRQFLAFLKENARPVAFSELKKILHITDDEVELLAFPLSQRRELYRTFSGRIGLTEGATVHAGTVSAHPKGFGFVSTEAGLEFFVPPPQMATLIAGDMVEFVTTVSPKDGKEAAEIVRLITRPETYWLGTLSSSAHGWLFTPDEAIKPQLVLKMDEGAAAEGDVIQVRVASETPLSTRVDAIFVQSLGPRGRAGFDTDYAIAKWRIPVAFGKTVQASIEAFADAVPVTADRRDLRDLPLVTIDGESTRDFDDAIFAEVREQEGRFRLVVAIADVSHYVQAGSALDQEAQTRGNSVYFPERVIPMLPERLSNDLCSLNPGMDRYVLVCDSVIGTAGEVESFEFYPAVMRSRARLTYNQVTHALEGGGTVEAELLPMLQTLNNVHRALRQTRQAHGMLEFYSREPKLVVENDDIIDVQWQESTVAHHIVEECMLVANRCAATFLRTGGAPALYRHHAAPEGEDWLAAKERLGELGYVLSEPPALLQLSRILDQARNSNYAGVVEEALRRAMRPAIYDTTMAAHFSLGFTAYTHFTSPIRRYPDLLIHRIIKSFVNNDAGSNATDPQDIAQACSLTSRRADRATRHVWTLIKRRHLAKYRGTQQSAKYLLGNKRGAKIVLLDFDCAAWVDAAALVEKGYTWNDANQRWSSSQLLEPGVKLLVNIETATENEVLATII